jgi:hypothetical protein
VQVAHRVHVDRGATAARELWGANRRLAERVLEDVVEFVESRAELIARGRCDAFTGHLEASEPNRRVLACGGVGDRLDPDLGVFLRPGAEW